MGVIDYVFGQNYVYLAHAPDVVTALSWSWSWPWYIVQSQLVILSLAIMTWGLAGCAWLWSCLMDKTQGLGFYVMRRWVEQTIRKMCLSLERL